MLLQHIIDIIESVAPRSWQEEWDNSGLQIGNPTADIRAALLTVDVTESVVSEAVSMGCNLIVSHHPLIFHGLKHLTGLTPQERCAEMAIRHGIAIYSAHTNMDSALKGVSGRMARVLGVRDYRILINTGNTSSSSNTSNTSSSSNTSNTSSSSKSSETSSTSETSSSGETGHGLGVIGTLPEPMVYTDFLTMVQERFEAPYVRYTEWDKPVQKIALCGGAGAEFADEAIRQGADVYLTADVKYHEAQAAEGRIGLVDLDHWVSEHYTRDIFKELLEEHVPCTISRADCSPIHLHGRTR